jgi:hypothetical protein
MRVGDILQGRLHTVGTVVGEHVSVMRVRSAEDAHDSGQRGFGSGSPVQRLDGPPHGLNFDHERGSPQQLAHPSPEVGRCRPSDRYRGRTSAQLDRDVTQVRRWRHRRQRHRHEPAGRCRKYRPRLAVQLPPAVHDVGIDAMCHRHPCNRRSRGAALSHHLRLQLRAVAPSQTSSRIRWPRYRNGWLSRNPDFEGATA